MTIEYRQTRDFTEEDLRRLFLSVGWESGRYLKRLVTAMRNSTHVISAWDGDRLIGLVRALDDGATIAFLHYVLVDPKYQGRHIGDELMKRIMKISPTFSMSRSSRPIRGPSRSTSVTASAGTTTARQW